MEEINLSKTKLKTRYNIIEASKQLFDKYGIENTTIKLLADECKITRKTIYDHFNNKDEIIEAILIEYFNELYDIDIISMSKDELMKSLIHKILDRYLDRPKVMRFLINYYQVNPNKLGHEDDLLENIQSINILKKSIDDLLLTNKEYNEEFQNKFHTVMEFIIGIGMRYSLRSGSFLGYDKRVSRESIHNALDILLTIF